MKFYQKLLVLMLTITLTLAFTTACKKKQASKEKGSDTYENVNNTNTSSSSTSPVSSAEGKKKGDNKISKYYDLLNKALELDSFYSENTLYINMTTMEDIYWVKGNKIKVGQTGSQSTDYNIFDLDKKEKYEWREDKGVIMKMSEEEITAAKSSAYWNGLYIEYFSEPGYVEILTEREEYYNGFPCVYLEMKNYEDDTLKVHISKEYGVVMSYEHYNKDTDLKLLECKRNHFEVGTVADDEFELPSDINFQQVPTY